MVNQKIVFLTFGLIVSGAFAASISDNTITGTPRIDSSDALITSIVNDCLTSNTMSCLKGKVLTYLDSILGLREEEARSFDETNVDKVIFDRVARVMATNEFKVQLPETVFGSTVVSYRADRGLDFELPREEGKLPDSCDDGQQIIINLH